MLLYVIKYGYTIHDGLPYGSKNLLQIVKLFFRINLILAKIIQQTISYTHPLNLKVLDIISPGWCLKGEEDEAEV